MSKFVRFMIALVIVMGMVGVVGAQEEDIPRERTFIFDIDGGGPRPNYGLLSPLIPSAEIGSGAHQAMYEPLFILNYETGEIEPWIGESFEPNETLDVWTLKIKDGVKWADGEAFNADDIVFTIQTRIDGSPEVRRSPEMATWVAEVNKIDDLTVEFVLTEPNPRFQLDYFSVKIWGSQEFVPEHIFADKDPLTFTFFDPEQGWPFGTGPYRLVSADEWEAVYERTDTWWGVETGFKDRMPYPEKLIWRAGANEETRVAAAAADEYDWIHDITLGAFEALVAQNPNWEAWLPEMPYVWLDPCARQIAFNTAVEPWNDKDMRWAMNYAIDRQEIVDFAYEGSTVPSRSMFVQYGAMEPYISAIEEEIYPEFNMLEYNPEKAMEIIESKGYTKNADGFYEKDGEVLDAVIQVHEGFIEKRRVAQVVVEQWQRIGVDASSQPIAGGTWGDNSLFGEFEIRADWDSCGSINEPWASMDRYNIKWVVPIGERASDNRWRWANEEYSALVDQIGVLPLGDPQIMPLFIDAMRIWTEELPVIPVTQARKLVPYNGTYWTGYPTSENNYNHPAAWWEHTHQIIHNLVPVDMVE